MNNIKKLSDAIEQGMMEVWVHPDSGSTSTISTCKLLMACGHTRAEANAERSKLVNELRDKGYYPKPR